MDLINELNQLCTHLTRTYPIEPPNTARFDDPEHRRQWKEDVWRALLLCFHQRYGGKSLKMTAALKVPGVLRTIDPADAKKIVHMTKKVAKKHNEIDHHLRQKDFPRIQAARLLTEPQVLAIMKPRDSTYARVLNQLLCLVVHADHGMEGYRVKKQDAIPFGLPEPLQPTLPKLKHSGKPIENPVPQILAYVLHLP